MRSLVLVCSPVRECGLTRSILEALGLRRRRRCRLIRREELCSVELLNLNTGNEDNHMYFLEIIQMYGMAAIHNLLFIATQLTLIKIIYII